MMPDKETNNYSIIIIILYIFYMYDVLHMCMDKNKNKFSILSTSFNILVRQMVE